MRKRHPRNWFYLYVSNRHVFKALPPESVGLGLIWACDYFADGTLPEAHDAEASIVFSILREAADESLADYNMFVEYGKLGPMAKAARAAEQAADE